MSNSGADNANGYAIARSALFDALRALAPLPAESFILVGAQAVYLRAPDPVIPTIAPFTLDGDLVVDPRKIARPRLIIELLERGGFSLRGENGLYELKDAPPNERYAARIDVFVPAAESHLWELEGYNARDSMATFSQPGLEVAIVDHSPMLIKPAKSVDQNESVTVEVAGTPSLLIAKGWKIQERHEQGAEAFREVVKDITDVYRLLRSTTPEDLQASICALPVRHPVEDVAKSGASYLRQLCTEGGPAIKLLYETLGDSDEVELIAESLQVLITEFAEFVEARFKSD